MGVRGSLTNQSGDDANNYQVRYLFWVSQVRRAMSLLRCISRHGEW